MYKALRISPMIPSFNVPETVSFFTGLLGFSTYINDNGYAILYKEETTIHILKAGDIGEMEFYLEIDDVDGLWNAISTKVKDLKVREPFDREYGMREMHIIVPHTKTLLFVGQVIKP